MAVGPVQIHFVGAPIYITSRYIILTFLKRSNLKENSK